MGSLGGTEATQVLAFSEDPFVLPPLASQPCPTLKPFSSRFPRFLAVLP